MQTSSLLLSLLPLLLLLGQAGATVNSCLTCLSIPGGVDANCTAGNEHVPKQSCTTFKEGCYVSVGVASGVESWARGCCASELCTEQHGEVEGVGMLDLVSCDTDNCNTMDPRNTAAGVTLSTLALLLPVLAACF